MEMFNLIVFSVVFLVVALFLICLSKVDKEHYDERQQIVRGKSYTYASAVIIITAFAYYIYARFAPESFVRLSAEDFAAIIIFLFTIIFGCHSIWNGSYYGVNKENENKISRHILWLVLGIMDFITFSINKFNPYNPLFEIENGIISFNFDFMYLLIGFDFLAMGITGIIRNLVNRRQEEYL